MNMTFLKAIGRSFLWPVFVVFLVLVALEWLSHLNKLLPIAFGLVGLWWVVRELLAGLLSFAVSDVLYGRKAALRSEIAAAMGIVRSDGDYSRGLENIVKEAIRSKEVQEALSETIHNILAQYSSKYSPGTG